MADPFTIGAGILGAGAVAGSIYEGSRNYNLSKEQLEWQKAAQRRTWRREDSAVQRRVSDLRKAGLSPTLAAGSAAQTSSPIPVNAPQSNITASAMDKVTATMALLKQKKDISATQAQTDLAQAQKAWTKNQDIGTTMSNMGKAIDNAEKTWNLAKAEEAGVATTDNGKYSNMIRAFEAVMNKMEDKNPKNTIQKIKEWDKKTSAELNAKGTAVENARREKREQFDNSLKNLKPSEAKKVVDEWLKKRFRNRTDVK